MDEWKVEVSALEMRTFLAASGRELLVRKDYTVLTTDEIDAFERVDDNHRTAWSNFDWFAIMDEGIIRDASAFSNVMGKYVVEGRVTARVRRIEARNAYKNYVEYVHGIDPRTGEMKRHTCNPRMLGDYADSSRLHSMTPIYFSRDVLNRYASEPNRYKVTAVGSGAWICGASTSAPTRLD